MKKGFKVFIVISIILFIITGLGLIAVSPYLSAVMKYRAAAISIASGSSALDFRSTESSVVYDINGEEITSINGAIELYYLEWVKIPNVIKNAFVLLEDRKFYKHKGIDVAAVVRSSIANYKASSKVQGASTITQQLARNIYLTQDVTWERKITEMFLAMELEKKYTKDQILEFYINNIYYANGFYGIEAAAQGYFSKSVNELTVSEMAFLVGIPNNPSKYNPVTNMKRTVERRDHILKVLHDFGSISDEEYETALVEEVVLVPSVKAKCDYVETYVYYCATRALMAANGFLFRDEFISEEDEENYNALYDDYYSRYQMSLFTGGYRIYTAIDMEKQKFLQDIVNDRLQEYTETNKDGVYKMQASAVCIDNSGGYVTAIVGGRDQGFPGYTLNRAYQSFRQPGSTIKPLVAYAPFLGLGHNPDYIIDDSPMEDGPENFEDRYPGECTLTEALGWSSNVAAWKLYEEITPEYGMSFVKKMHFKRIGEDEHYMASCLGGWTYGASALEMASAYAAIVNDGVYREPTTVIKITDSKNYVIVDNDIRGMKVYEKDASRMINKMLQYGVESGLAINARLDNAVVAVKTGTTTGNKDGWTIGYSMYYTTAVWVGCDLPASVPELTGGTYPMSIWKDYMHGIHEELEVREFPDYERYGEKKDDENNIDNNETDGNETESATGQPTGSGNGNGGGQHGDVDAPVKGDADASGTGGDKPASGNTGGDKPAGGNQGGDKPADGAGGDKPAGGNQGGDKPAGGNQGGDVSVPGGQGDKPATGTDGDKPANGTGGDKPATGKQGGDVSAP